MAGLLAQRAIETYTVRDPTLGVVGKLLAGLLAQRAIETVGVDHLEVGDPGLLAGLLAQRAIETEIYIIPAWYAVPAA